MNSSVVMTDNDIEAYYYYYYYYYYYSSITPTDSITNRKITMRETYADTKPFKTTYNIQDMER